MVIFIVTVLLGLSTVFYIWRLPPFSLNSVYTNNAYVRGQITLISPKVSGYIKAVPVQDFEPVKKEQTLVIIDPETYLAKVAQAEANLKAQQAALERIPQTRVTAEATLSLRRAAIDSAKAQFNLAAIEQNESVRYTTLNPFQNGNWIKRIIIINRLIWRYYKQKNSFILPNKIC